MVSVLSVNLFMKLVFSSFFLSSNLKKKEYNKTNA